MNTSGVSQLAMSKTGTPVPQAVSVPGNMCKIISSGMLIHKANSVLFFCQWTRGGTRALASTRDFLYHGFHFRPPMY